MFHWQDIKYSLRLLAKTPVFTVLTIVVLAGGLGVSIFTFSFLYTAMVKPLPVPGGESIVRVMQTPQLSGLIDAADVAAIRPQIKTLTDVGIFVSHEVVVGSAEATRAIGATAAEWNVFDVTRTRALLGRGLLPRDQEAGAEPVVVLSHRIWRAVFGSDSALVGKLVPLNGVPTRVVGVMPAGYGFPVAAEAWLPIRPALLTADVPDQQAVQVYARLAPGVDAERATAELSSLLLRVRRARPAVAAEREAAEPTGMTVQSFPMSQIGEQAPLALAVLNTLAGLILLLACVNVTNLLLARANERARETALRLALGAPRGRLIMQSMWETILLCVAGGTLATLLATWGLRGIDRWANANLEGNLVFWWVWGFDRIVLLSAGVFVTVTIAALGGVVAARATTLELNSLLQQGGSRGGSRREGKVARALVVTQVATVSVLMFFGSMSAIVAHRVANVDLGYDTRNLLNGSVELAPERYATSEARGLLYQQLYERLSVHQAVDGVLLRTPLADITGDQGQFTFEGTSALGQPHTFVQAVLGPLTPLGIGLNEGRFFDARDGENGARVALVSAAFAARYSSRASVLGRQIVLSGLGEREPRTVVGVVGDVLLGNPLSRDRSAIAAYIPLRQSPASSTDVLFRHSGSVTAAQAAFHQTLLALDPQIAKSNVQSFDELLAKTSLMARSVATLFGACFGFALLLAVSGTYGLMARSIGRRTREIGVRRALGATDRMILQLLLGQGGRQLGVGALVALPVTLLIAWGFSHFFPIAPVVSLSTAVLVSVAITGIVLLATWFPTRRAVALQPRDALWRD